MFHGRFASFSRLVTKSQHKDGGAAVNLGLLDSTSLYDILEERGFEVDLVKTRHTKNLAGRKMRCKGKSVAARFFGKPPGRRSR